MEKTKANYLRAYEALKAGLVEGSYPEDHLFVETELAQQLGMSRTPVREALRMLRAEKLLVGVPGRGLMAPPLQKREVEGVYQLAEALEGMMAYLVTERAGGAALEQLQGCVLRMEQALQLQDKEGWALADRAYHETLAKLCGNEFLQNAIASLNVYIDMIRYRFTKKLQEERKSSTLRHREEYEAIRFGDAEYARMTVQHHWRAIRRQVVRAVGKNEGTERVEGWG